MPLMGVDEPGPAQGFSPVPDQVVAATAAQHQHESSPHPLSLLIIMVDEDGDYWIQVHEDKWIQVMSYADDRPLSTQTIVDHYKAEPVTYQAMLEHFEVPLTWQAP
jgi:hypothetical protein